MDSPRNIVLIGMPGAGKSTIGVLLAKELSYPFVDTDNLIQSRTGKQLATIIAQHGLGYFKELEEHFVCQLDCGQAVIATGGSVVYSERAMRHLKAHGLLIWLDLGLHALERRLGDLNERGVVIGKGQSLTQLYQERRPLYAKYKDVTVSCDGLDHSQVVAEIVHALEQKGKWRPDQPPPLLD